jgi:hypothetical protein
VALGRARTNGRLWRGDLNDLKDSQGLRQAGAYGHLAIKLGETQHAEGLVLGDNRETRWNGGTELAAQPGQYREDRGVDESAVGEVDQERPRALRQSLLDLCLELSNGGQVQLPAHLKCRDTRLERPVIDLGFPRFKCGAVVESCDSRDAISF